MKKNVILLLACLLAFGASSQVIMSESRPAAQVLRLPADVTKPGIGDFAAAYLNAVSASDDPLESRAVAMMRSNLGKSQVSSDEMTMSIDRSKGYARFEWMVQYDEIIEMCYWNRSDGKKLLGVCTTRNHENSEGSVTLAFYLLDATHHKLMFSKTITDKVTQSLKRVQRIPGANPISIAVKLPRQGKDIGVTRWVIHEDNDYADDPMYYELKWNGKSFNAATRR